jgi:hypothetical protein
METNHLGFAASPMSQPNVFAIDFSDPGKVAPFPGGSYRQSIVVRIEPQDVLFILSATEPEGATRSFAEALAKQTALSAIEKDIPIGVELTLSAKEIDRVPPEIENRLPDFWMNGNKAWLVAPDIGHAEPTTAQSAAA